MYLLNNSTLLHEEACFLTSCVRKHSVSCLKAASSGTASARNSTRLIWKSSQGVSRRLCCSGPGAIDPRFNGVANVRFKPTNSRSARANAGHPSQFFNPTFQDSAPTTSEPSNGDTARNAVVPSSLALNFQTGSNPSVGTEVGCDGAQLQSDATETSDALATDDKDDFEQRLRHALNLAWIMNTMLLGAKLYAFYISNSKAVLASLADSVVDIVSQLVILLTAAVCKSPDLKHYPVGRARLEAIGVLACACIMSVCAVEVIKSGIADLYQGWVLKELPFLDTSAVMYCILFLATGVKFVAYNVCAQLQSRSDFMVALAEDQLNDVMSNGAALVCGAVAGLGAHFWWMDAVGAIGISLYIVYRWAQIALNQVDKIVGRVAPPDLVRKIEKLAKAHDKQMVLSGLKAYHFGSKCMVEMEVVMPEDLPLKQVHGIAMKLQCKVESLEEVERAFVNVDYRHRPEPVHKMERLLMGLPPSWKLAPL